MKKEAKNMNSREIKADPNLIKAATEESGAIIEAELSPGQIGVAKYGRIINILMQKGFKLPQIADWLNEHNEKVTFEEVVNYRNVWTRQRLYKARKRARKRAENTLEKLNE